MDPVSQFVLGASVGTAVLGRRMGVRKAALAGGLLGVLPDTDVLWPFENEVDSFVLHRGPTHSLVMQALVTPVFAEALRLVDKSLRDARWQTYLGVFLCLATHSLLDAMTIYGTRLLWPLWPEPFGVGSIFIIDPLYTLPLLVVVVWALFKRDWSPGFGRALAAALVLSTAYLGWGVVGQSVATARAERALADAGIRHERAFATPVPLNSFFWRVVAIDGPRYYNVYVPLLGADETITAYRHPRLTVSSECLNGNEWMRTLNAFSKGFFRLDMGPDGRLVMSDLRMGLTPRYVFRFVVAEQNGHALEEAAPVRIRSERAGEGDFGWMWAGVRGEATLRPSERQAAIDLAAAPAVEAVAVQGPAAPLC